MIFQRPKLLALLHSFSASYIVRVIEVRHPTFATMSHGNPTNTFSNGKYCKTCIYFHNSSTNKHFAHVKFTIDDMMHCYLVLGLISQHVNFVIDCDREHSENFMLAKISCFTVQNTAHISFESFSECNDEEMK
jgi:hypothetical protein